jgi:uncharacterized membrane protein YdbT with pleckstrin-like domain
VVVAAMGLLWPLLVWRDPAPHALTRFARIASATILVVGGAGVFAASQLEITLVSDHSVSVALLLLLVAIMWQVAIWLSILTTRYRLTTQRLFSAKGLIFVKKDELELHTVHDITVKYSILERILGFGTIVVHCGDATTPILELEGIDRPDEIKELLRGQAKKLRDRKVRFIDQVDDAGL